RVGFLLRVPCAGHTGSPYIRECELMSLAILLSRAIYGFQAQPVRVEVHVGSGLPTFLIVGLPDAGVRESRERVRSALQSCGFALPPGRVTVNLAPADLPKDSGRYDLAIALGILLASGQVQIPEIGRASCRERLKIDVVPWQL